MISLGGQSFTGPFLAPVWSPAKVAGIFAVMVPGWRVMTFRALHFDQAAELSIDAIRKHPRYAEWVSIAGTEWNVYIAVREMALSTEAERQAVERALARDYRPEFNDLAPEPQQPGIRTLLLAQAMREGKND